MIAALGARLIAAGHPPSGDFGADSTLPVSIVQT
jgi:N6-L-threonylcarbamoyladenine synthase